MKTNLRNIGLTLIVGLFTYWRIEDSGMAFMLSVFAWIQLRILTALTAIVPMINLLLAEANYRVVTDAQQETETKERNQ